MRLNQTRIRAFFLRCSFAILALMGAATPAMASNNIMADFIGDWQSDGDAFGQPSISTLSWTPTLDDKFMKISYEIRTRSASETKAIFTGIGYYRNISETELTAFWADSSGDLHPITASIKGKTIISTWGIAGGKLGRTHYNLTENDTIEVTDWLLQDDGWRQFNHNVFNRKGSEKSESNAIGGAKDMEKVTGIGGIFFRAKNTVKTSQWYADNLGINLPPKGYDEEPWRQEAGITVFTPFEQDTEYFGAKKQQWMINFRVQNLDAIVVQLRKQGNEVEVDPETYPNGRFARTQDPEGTPIQLWEPS